MKFKNIETGNVLTVKNADTIALMKKSDRYVEVTAKAKKSGKKDAPAGN